MHVIFNYVTNVAAAVGNADKFTEISLKFYSLDYSYFVEAVLTCTTYKLSTLPYFRLILHFLVN